VLLILLFSGYLTQAIVRPVRQAAAMAGQLAGGDLAVRLPERGVDEIGLLERSFNSMAGSLEETATSSIGSWTSRPRSAASPPSWLAGSRRPRCSPRSPRRSAGC
jgi:HAMP domain-containing protein